MPNNVMSSLAQKINLMKAYKEQENEAKAKYKALESEVLLELLENNLKEFKTEKEVTAKITSKTTFKYLNESEMISILKEKGFNNLIKISVDTTPMNNLLKKEKLSDNEKLLVESIKPLTERNESLGVSVK